MNTPNQIRCAEKQYKRKQIGIQKTEICKSISQKMKRKKEKKNAENKIEVALALAAIKQKQHYMRTLQIQEYFFSLQLNYQQAEFSLFILIGNLSNQHYSVQIQSYVIQIYKILLLKAEKYMQNHCKLFGKRKYFQSGKDQSKINRKSYQVIFGDLTLNQNTISFRKKLINLPREQIQANNDFYQYLTFMSLSEQESPKNMSLFDSLFYFKQNVFPQINKQDPGTFQNKNQQMQWQTRHW